MSPFTSPAVTARLSPLLISQNAQRILLSQHQQTPPFSLARHAVFSRNKSSLSAIVRGLKHSFRDSDGKRPPGYNPEVAAHVTKRRKEREAAAPPAYKLFRGKKDVTEPAVPKAKTRRARFFDPEDDYGKKSLVYQAKSGALEAEVKALRKQHGGDEQSEAPRSKDGFDDQGFRNQFFGEDEGEANTRGGRNRGGDRGDGGGRNMRGNRERGGDCEPRSGSDRSGGSSFGRRDDSRDGFSSRSRQGVTGRRGSGDDREDRGSRYHDNGDREGNDREYEHRGRGSRDRRFSGFNRVRLTIPYTTAASQFLYGRNVVQAALSSARRKLYKLYVYGGSTRSSGFSKRAWDNTPSMTDSIIQMSSRLGIETQVVDERWLPLMEKMSRSRPHNGVVLEASPLPQPPVTALGPYFENGTEEGPERGPGFGIELGPQSREETDINGSKPYVTLGRHLAGPKHHKPLVLLLDGILDPGNLGAILRSASFLGVSAVAMSKKSSATLTSVSIKASAGASEFLPLFSTDDTVAFLEGSRKAGWKVYTAVPPPLGYDPALNKNNGRPYMDMGKPVIDLNGIEANDPLQDDPIILVMGSEGAGLKRAVRRAANVQVSIANRSSPDAMVVDSLNVSVATSLLCASFLRSASGGAAHSKPPAFGEGTSLFGEEPKAQPEK